MERKKPRMLIRADGSTTIGMGHISRTSVLAEVLAPYLEVIFVSLKECELGAKAIRERGFEVRLTSKEDIFEVLASSGAVGIITDCYAIDETYIQEVRRLFKWVGYIDDNGEKYFDADLVLNQNFRAETIPYRVNKECKLLLGTQYVLLREIFRQEKAIISEAKITKVLLTVGGGDPYDYTGKILEKICQLPYTFQVVIGAAFPHEDDLYKKYASFKNIIFHKSPDMYTLMRSCHIAISTCGSTLYELGSLGIPTIGVSIVDNQVPLAKRMGEAGCIVYLGDMRKGLQGSLSEAVDQLGKDKAKREAMKERNAHYVNKYGVEKVAWHILAHIKER